MWRRNVDRNPIFSICLNLSSVNRSKRLASFDNQVFIYPKRDFAMYIDNLKEIIQTLSLNEQKEFRIFINRQKVKSSRKDLDLFDMLSVEKWYTSAEMMTKLYGRNNPSAYHMVRKRLVNHLTDFIVLKRMDDDTTASSSIMGLISLSSYLFERRCNRLGWHYLLKSEQSALKNEIYDLLDNIYNLQMEHAAQEYAPPIETIIERWKYFKEIAVQEERANMACSFIEVRLKDKMTKGSNVDLDLEIQSVMESFDISEDLIQKPKLLYKFLSIIRSAVLVNREYYGFEPIIIEHYSKVLNGVGFEKKDHYYKLGLLYMIVHVLYRNRKFSKAEVYLNELGRELGKYKKSYRAIFFPRYVQLLAAIWAYKGENKKSIELCENTLETEKKLELLDQLNIHLNLSVYYFQQEQYKKANYTLMRIKHTDRWCAKKMGQEWVMKKQLIEIIIQFELGNDHVCQYRIESFERQHREFLNTPFYKRVTIFVGFIKKCLSDPAWITTEEFQEYVYNTLELAPTEEEDLHAMTFFSWIKSKMSKRPYYQILVEMVNQTGEEVDSNNATLST